MLGWRLSRLTGWERFWTTELYAVRTKYAQMHRFHTWNFILAKCGLLLQNEQPI
jgi:hypothetical protein